MESARLSYWSSFRRIGPGCCSNSMAAAGPISGSISRHSSGNWASCSSRPSGAWCRAEPHGSERGSERDVVVSVRQIRDQRRSVPGGRFRCGCSGRCSGRGCSTADRPRCSAAASRCALRSRSNRHGSGRRGCTQRVQPGQGELRPLLLDAVLTGDRVHPQPTLQHQALTNLHAVLQILGQVAPTHHADLTRRVLGAQSIELDRHLGHRRLIVLGVAQLGSLQHLHLQQAMVHGRNRGQGATS